MGAIAYLIVIALLVLSVRRLFRSRTKPIVVVTGSEVSVRGWRTSSTLSWSRICRIDVARAPEIGVDDFCAILSADGGEALSVSDTYDGFKAFQEAMFARWPQIEAEWRRVRALPADLSQRSIAWRRN
ncbi:MAG: hypothetical protein KGJ78_06660 [Alphaproteobacteria bacterium]|nr:hypothetical protein [Alphaproteobacteria bacterium]